MTDLVTLYTGAHIVHGDSILKDDLWVQNGKIIDPKSVNYNAYHIVDLAGRIVSPGFIDLKLNGSFGVNFSELSDLKDESMEKVRTKLAEFGVTSFMPCVTPVSPCDYSEILPVLSAKVDESRTTVGAELLGIHLDGPLHSKHKGHCKEGSPLSARTENIRTAHELEHFYGGNLDKVKIISMAPELPGVATEIIPHLVSKGIKVSLGHTVCSIEQAEAAVRAGASLIGHLFNGMPNFHHRDPSLVGILASNEINDQPIYFGLIADLVHTHPASLAMAHKLHPHTLMVVSDAVYALGLTDISNIENVYKHISAQGNEIEIRRSDDAFTAVAAYEGDSNRLIGSCTPINEALRNLLYHTDCSFVEAIKAVTIRPAKALGVEDRKGHLNFGADADFVTLDKHFTVLSTYTKGELVYKRPKNAAESRSASRVTVHTDGVVDRL